MASRVAASHTACVVCGCETSAAELVCTFCLTDRGQAADVLIVVKGEERAEARVPRAVSELALERARGRGLSAVAVPVALAWTAIPRATWLLIALVAVANVGAVRYGVLDDLGPAMAVVGCLLVAATIEIRKPRRMPASHPFSSTQHDAMLRALTELPSGAARDQLVELTMKVRAFFALRDRYAMLTVFADGVLDLYGAACTAARDLESVEALLGRDRAAARDTTARADLAREREQLMMQLGGASDQLDRICQLGLDERDADGLDALLDELHRATEAMRAVNRLVASAHRPGAG